MTVFQSEFFVLGVRLPILDDSVAYAVFSQKNRSQSLSVFFSILAGFKVFGGVLRRVLDGFGWFSGRSWVVLRCFGFGFGRVALVASVVFKNFGVF